MAFILLSHVCARRASTYARRLTPETKALIDRILRVDHAGEFGAVKIYQGQLAVLGNTPVGPILEHFLDQEKDHLTTMQKLVPEHEATPTLLLPLWEIVGYALGAGSAMLGKEAAMACTVAVETAIGEHYDNQIRALMADGENGLEDHRKLLEVLSKLRDDELEHLDTGLKNNAEQAPLYTYMSEAIKFGCRGAIWLSERI